MCKTHKLSKVQAIQFYDFDSTELKCGYFPSLIHCINSMAYLIIMESIQLCEYLTLT